MSANNQPLTKEQVFQLAKDKQLYAGNLIEGASSTRTVENTTPIDNSVIGNIADATAEDVDVAVVSAREQFNQGEWRKLPPAERKRRMQKWARLLETHLEELGIRLHRCWQAYYRMFKYGFTRHYRNF